MNNTYYTEYETERFILENQYIIKNIRNYNINKNKNIVKELRDKYIELQSNVLNGAIYFYNQEEDILWEFDRCGTGNIFMVENEKIYNLLINYNKLNNH